VNQSKLLGQILASLIDRHDHWLTVSPGSVHMSAKIGESRLQRLHIRLRQYGDSHSAMHLQCPDRRYDDNYRRVQTGGPALDPKKLLGAKIKRESRLSHRVITKRQSHPCRERGVTAMSDIGERASVHKRWRSLPGLHQIRHDGVI
jgi:hypothetical protein